MADISGIIISSVTPFTQSHELDDAWVAEYLSHLSDGGVQGVLVLDTVSEGPTLSLDEMQRLVDATSENIGGLQHIVGSGASDLNDSIAILSHGLGKGADAVLLRTPGNESNSSEDIQFISTVLRELPDGVAVILGGGVAPGAQDLSDDSINSLLDQSGDKIIGVQSRSKDAEEIKRLIATYSNLGVYTALDATMIQGFGLGASGAFSIFGNVVPSSITQIVELHKAGEDLEDKMWLLDQLEEIFHEHGMIGAVKGIMPLLAEPRMTYPREPNIIPGLGDLKKLEDRMIEVFNLDGLFHSFS